MLPSASSAARGPKVRVLRIVPLLIGWANSLLMVYRIGASLEMTGTIFIFHLHFIYLFIVNRI